MMKTAFLYYCTRVEQGPELSLQPIYQATIYTYSECRSTIHQYPNSKCPPDASPTPAAKASHADIPKYGSDVPALTSVNT